MWKAAFSFLLFLLSCFSPLTCTPPTFPQAQGGGVVEVAMPIFCGHFIDLFHGFNAGQFTRTSLALRASRRSLCIRRSGKLGVKSRCIQTAPCIRQLLSHHGGADEETSCWGSTPSLVARVRPSAKPSKIMAICRFMESLVFCPLPVSPIRKIFFPWRQRAG